MVRRPFAAHIGTYGSPRIAAEPREEGWLINDNNTVAAIMAELGMAARWEKRRRLTTRRGRSRWQAPDLMHRNFSADAPTM